MIAFSKSCALLYPCYFCYVKLLLVGSFFSQSVHESFVCAHCQIKFTFYSIFTYSNRTFSHRTVFFTRNTDRCALLFFSSSSLWSVSATILCRCSHCNEYVCLFCNRKIILIYMQNKRIIQTNAQTKSIDLNRRKTILFFVD